MILVLRGQQLQSELVHTNVSLHLFICYHTQIMTIVMNRNDVISWRPQPYDGKESSSYVKDVLC